MRLAILNERGDPVPAGTDGLIYYTPWNRVRYHNDPAKTAAAWRGDLFTVGDIGRVDGDGYLYITDRRDDMIIRGGVNIYPREIENVLLTHPAVVDCAVFGVPDQRSGEAIKAMLEVREPVTEAEIKEFCRRSIADYKCPHIVEFVDRLPRDPSGKIMKRLLRESRRGAPRP